MFYRTTAAALVALTALVAMPAQAIKFNWGEVKNRNFDTYQITTFSMVPKIGTVLIDDMDSPPLGGGEPSIICVGAAISNAIFDACGARLYQMPMTPERVLAGIGLFQNPLE